MVPLDTCASISNLLDYRYADIAAGTSVEGTQSQYIQFNPNCSSCIAHFTLEIMSNNYPFWSDTFAIDIVSGIQQGEPIVKEFKLKQNYPNPFNPTTTISYDLPLPSHVLLQVYDMQGREVTRLVNEKLNAGSHTTYWNAAGFASGVYLYRLQAGNYTETKKLILLK